MIFDDSHIASTPIEYGEGFQISGCWWVTLALYRRRAFRKKVCTSAALWRAFDKAVRRKPPVVAADAGLMEIEWGKTAVRSVAEAVRYSRADDSDN